jgi:hypothetical protein
MEPSLRRVVETRPDSTVHVLIRLTRDVQEGDRERLIEAGLSFSSARGRVVTGSLRAINAIKVSRLSVVAWMEIATGLAPNPPIRRNRSSATTISQSLY